MCGISCWHFLVVCLPPRQVQVSIHSSQQQQHLIFIFCLHKFSFSGDDGGHILGFSACGAPAATTSAFLDRRESVDSEDRFLVSFHWLRAGCVK